MILIKNLSKRYGNKTVLNKLNFSIEKGGMTAILGPNGAGKSTLINILLNFIQRDTGKIIFDEDSRIGVVFQNSIMDDLLTVRENLLFKAKQYHNFSNEYFNKLIKEMNLENILDEKYQNLSGGQKRLVDITRALVNQPNILFLDEPTTGLDVQTRFKIWNILNKLMGNYNITIVLTTHYLAETNNAKKIIIINYGNIIANGSAKAIIEQYAKNHLLIETKNYFSYNSKLQWKDLGNNKIKITINDFHEAICVLKNYESQIKNFEYRRGTIDEAFLNLTGRTLIK